MFIQKTHLHIASILTILLILAITCIPARAQTVSTPLSVLPRALHLGGVIVGQSTTQVIFLQVRNLSMPLQFTLPTDFSISTNGEAGRFFTTSLTCSLAEANSASAIMLTIRFHPTTVGLAQRTLTVQTDTSSTMLLSLPLSGEGIASSPRTVRFVNERMYVRDQAFFPIGWSQIGTRDNYGLIGEANKRSELAGVNFVESEGTAGSMNVGGGEHSSIWKADGNDYNNPDTVRYYLRRYLDTCQKGGVKTLLNLYEYYVNKNVSGITAASKAGTNVRMERRLSDADIQAIIGDSSLSNHPALLGWWISSEPVGKFDQAYSALYNGKSTPFPLAPRGKTKTDLFQEVNAEVSKFYPLQTEQSRLYRLAKQADGGKHPIGTMFQAGSMLEMTGMLHLYPNPTEPFFDFVLAEHYNSPLTATGLLYDIFERSTPLQDSVRIKNGDANGNFYYRNFRTAAPSTQLTQDMKLMNREVRDYYSRFHPTGTSNGGIILKLFGQKYEADTDQNVRPTSQRELMFTTFTEIHALQNYGRPTVLGGLDVFGFDYFSSLQTVSDGNGGTKRVWGLTPQSRKIRQEQQDFLAFWGKNNLGMVFQEPAIAEFQGDEFCTLQVGSGTSKEEQSAAQAIKRVVRYHDGYLYLALTNTRLNETMPPELTTATARFTAWGAKQEFVTTNNVRVIFPQNLTIAECVELSPESIGNEKRIPLERANTPEGAQTLAISTLDAAETRVFRLQMAQTRLAVQLPVVAQIITKPAPQLAPTPSTSKSKTTKRSKRKG